MKKLIEIEGDVYRADAISLIEVSDNVMYICLAHTEDYIEYEYDSDDECRGAQLAAVKAWREALS